MIFDGFQSDKTTYDNLQSDRIMCGNMSGI